MWGYEAFVLTPVRRNEGFFIFCARFRAGACIERMRVFSARQWGSLCAKRRFNGYIDRGRAAWRLHCPCA